MDWRDTLDPILKEHFHDLITKVHAEKKAYTSAKNISHAQLWCALAVLAKEVSNLELHIKELKKQSKSRDVKRVKRSMEKL